MKILVMHYHNLVFKDDTDVFCEGLTKLGHEMIKIDFLTRQGNIMFEHYDLPYLKDIDLIWAPYEIEISAAEYFKSLLNKPIVGHFEWVAPWRVGKAPTYWGYDDTNVHVIDKDLNLHKMRYMNFLKQYLRCDIKTIADPYTLSTIEKFGGIKILNYYRKPYIVDTDLLLSQKDDSIEQKYQIMSTARLVPHKRIHHVIGALSKVKNAPPYKIIGVGGEKERLEKLAKDLNVDVEFVGVGQKGEKAKLIQESLFSINIWSALPVGESAALKKHSLVYEHENVYNSSGNIPTYVKWNDIDDLANKIQYLIDNPESTKELGEKSYESLMSGENGTMPSRNGCLIMEKIFKEALK